MRASIQYAIRRLKWWWHGASPRDLVELWAPAILFHIDDLHASGFFPGLRSRWVHLESGVFCERCKVEIKDGGGHVHAFYLPLSALQRGFQSPECIRRAIEREACALVEDDGPSFDKVASRAGTITK